eukprot:g12809.t1
MFKKRDGQLLGEKKTIKRAREGANSAGEMMQFCAVSINSAIVEHETAVCVSCRVDKVERRLLKSPEKAFKGFVIRIDTQAVRRQWGALILLFTAVVVIITLVVVILFLCGLVFAAILSAWSTAIRVSDAMVCSVLEYSLGLKCG